jgi:hypothetical protein
MRAPTMPPNVTTMIVPQAPKTWANARTHTLRTALLEQATVARAANHSPAPANGSL